jgi:lipopolysaccharide export system ATP-binding protein
MATIEARGLIKTYKLREVVKGVTLSVKSGEVVGLLGPNGAGKTTTFYMVVGLAKPDGGRVMLDGTDITHWPMYKRARQGIGYLPQEASVFRKLTVEENILAILETLDLSQSQRREKLTQLLAELDISHLAKHKAYSLSGGERRRLEITRSLVTSPAFILFDEPFAGIDPKAVEDIQNIIQKLKAKGIGILITDHSVREMLEITDRSYIIHKGEILVSGAPFELVNNELVKEIYLGENFSL